MRDFPLQRSARAALLCLACAAAAAGAQTPADTTVSADTAARLAAVEVSAQRIAGASASAPFAIAVRTAGSLPQGTPALALDEALRGIPGVQIDNRFNYALGERISVRGAGARAQFGVRGVRVLVDGIPATLPDGQTTLNQVDLTTVHRVEVVRGPVASLFGNASGGAILIETAPPPRAPIAGEGVVMTGSHGLLRTRAQAGGTHGAASYAASVSRVAYGGFRTHSDAENRYASARASWLGARDYVRAIVNIVDYDARNPGSLSDSLLRADRRQAFRNNVLQGTGERGAQQQAGLQWRRALAGDELELTGWTIARDVDNPIPARIVVIDRLATGVRALHRGERERIAWTAGLEHEVQRDDRRNFVNTEGARGNLVLDQDERVTALGAFAQASVPLHARLTVLAGLRHDRTVFRAEDRLVTDSDPDDSGSRTLGAVSPAVGATWRLPADVTMYANAGGAFETPTTTELANRPDGAGGFNPILAPQRTVSYEIGARRDRAGIAAQVAAYRAFVRDALIPFEVPDVPGRQFFRNAGRTRAAGAEAAISLRPLAVAQLDAAYSYTDARFRQYVVGDVSHESNRLPGVAPHRAELTGTIRHRGSWVAADLRHQSRMAVDDANTAYSSAHTITDVRLGGRALRAGATRLELFAGLQNVFDVQYNASVVVNAFGRRFYEPGPGRTFHVGGTLRAW